MRSSRALNSSELKSNAFQEYECMAAVRQDIPDAWPDPHKHCMAAALIARHCSTVEAYLAGLGKELRDVFTAGDASWADWRADRIGVQCARSNTDGAALETCCVEKGY